MNKKLTDKKKTNLFMVSEFQENKFKIAQKDFQKIIKDILENPSVTIIIT